MTYRAKLNGNLIAVATLLAVAPSPASAQTPATQNKAASTQSVSDMTVEITDSYPIRTSAVPYTPLYAAPVASAKPSSAEEKMFQIMGTGDMALPFDPDLMVSALENTSQPNFTTTLLLLVNRQGKVANCTVNIAKSRSNQYMVDQMAHSKTLCKTLDNKPLYHWRGGAPFAQEQAITAVRFWLEPKPPFASKLKIVKPGKGITMSTTFNSPLYGDPCVAHIIDGDGARDMLSNRQNGPICTFAKAQAKKRGLTLPSQGEKSSKPGAWREATVRFSLKAAPDYVAGKPRPLTLAWQEVRISDFRKIRYPVPPIADGTKMPPLGRLILPDLDGDEETARRAVFDPRDTMGDKLWETRIRAGVRLDGTIASCQPTTSFGSMPADQYMCDAVMRKGHYRFNKAQAIPPSMKPDAIIKYVEQTMRSDGAFVSFSE